MPPSVRKSVIARALDGTTPGEAEAEGFFASILAGEVGEPELAAFLTAIAKNPVTAGELAGAARAMSDAAVKIDLHDLDIVDIVGTGGDGRSTFNISTTAAFVAAGAGVKIAKHGNVAATSKCGAADVLRELGADLSLPPSAVRECFDRTGVAFLFAQRYHSGMRFAANVRRYLGFKTLFNLLGPLTNPAGARRSAIGVYDPKLVPLIAETLKRLGAVRDRRLRPEARSAHGRCAETARGRARARLLRRGGNG